MSDLTEFEYRNLSELLAGTDQFNGNAADSSEAEFKEPAVSPEEKESKDPAVSTSRKRKMPSPPQLVDNDRGSSDASRPAEATSIPHPHLVLVDQNATKNNNVSTIKETVSKPDRPISEVALVADSGLILKKTRQENDFHGGFCNKDLRRLGADAAKDLVANTDSNNTQFNALPDHDYLPVSRTVLEGPQTASSQAERLDANATYSKPTATEKENPASGNKELSQQCAERDSSFTDAELDLLHKVSSELIRARKINKDLSSTILEKNNEIDCLKESLKEENDKVSSYEEEIQTSKDAFEKELDGYSQKLLRFEQENLELRKENERVEEDIVEAMNKCSKFQTWNDHLQRNAQATEQLQNENHQLQTEIGKLHSALENVQRENEEMEGSMQEIRESTKEVEIPSKEKCTLECDIAGLKTQKEEMQIEIQDMTIKAISVLEKEKSSIEQKIAEMRARMRNAEKGCSSLEPDGKVGGNSLSSIADPASNKEQ